MAAEFTPPKTFDEAMETVQESVAAIEADREKTNKGVAKAGRRVRAELQTIAKTCKAARKLVTELKGD